uniref:Uncharacterized protein n=1 Tax=Populus davidiana TaxID=266767 RepID=A0A6M2E647_9ROSI
MHNELFSLIACVLLYINIKQPMKAKKTTISLDGKTPLKPRQSRLGSLNHCHPTSFPCEDDIAERSTPEPQPKLAASGSSSAFDFSERFPPNRCQQKKSYCHLKRKAHNGSKLSTTIIPQSSEDTRTIFGKYFSKHQIKPEFIVRSVQMRHP